MAGADERVGEIAGTSKVEVEPVGEVTCKVGGASEMTGEVASMGGVRTESVNACLSKVTCFEESRDEGTSGISHLLLFLRRGIYRTFRGLSR
jgi:hypothetical protein